MTPEEPNERVKSLIADMEKIGARPAYLRGGSYNDYLEYGRLKDLIAKECIAALCVYLVKQSGGKKRWTSSQNLERPTSRTNDGKYNRRQIEKWARERPGREFWEKKYPGWTLTDEDYGIEYKYNDFTGWSIYLKLRKKE